MWHQARHGRGGGGIAALVLALAMLAGLCQQSLAYGTELSSSVSIFRFMDLNRREELDDRNATRCARVKGVGGLPPAGAPAWAAAHARACARCMSVCGQESQNPTPQAIQLASQPHWQPAHAHGAAPTLWVPTLRAPADAHHAPGCRCEHMVHRAGKAGTTKVQFVITHYFVDKDLVSSWGLGFKG